MRDLRHTVGRFKLPWLELALLAMMAVVIYLVSFATNTFPRTK